MGRRWGRVRVGSVAGNTHQGRNFRLGGVDDCGVEIFASDAPRGLGSGASRQAAPRRRVFVAGVDSVGYIDIKSITGKSNRECHRRTNNCDGDDDEERGDRGCCERGSYQHRYGDDGERAGTDDSGGDGHGTSCSCAVTTRNIGK